MALNFNLQYQRSLDYFSIIAVDNTGSYDVNSNPGGYGVVNPVPGDFTSASLVVTMPDSVTLLPTGPSYTFNALTLLNSTWNIPNTSLGLAANDKIPDGIYKFNISGTAIFNLQEITYEQEVYVPFYQIVGCCIESLTIAAFPDKCGCNKEYIERLVKANMWLSLLKPVLNGLPQITICGQYEKAAEIIRELQKICNNKNCKGCGGC